MQEVIFDIPTIKKLEPKLYEHFGFTLDDILYELTQVYTKKVFNLNRKKKSLPISVNQKMVGEWMQ